MRRTINDQDRRYSLVKRIEAGLTVIEAAKTNPMAQALLDIQRSVTDLHLTTVGAQRDLELFPWPALLNRASSVLDTVLGFLDATDAGDEQQLREDLHQLSRRFDVGRSENLQFMVLDEAGRVVYHEWRQIIGATLLETPHGGRYFAEALRYRRGAFAWSDTIGLSDRIRRRNIGLYAEAKGGLFRVIVEVHVLRE